MTAWPRWHSRGARDAAGNSNQPATHATFTIATATGKLEVRTVLATRVRVSRGQTVLGLTMTVANPGEARTELTGAMLTFAGSQAGYLVTPRGGPASLAAGEVSTFSFDVTVLSSAPLGVTIIDGTASGTDTAHAEPVSAPAAQTAATWEVQTPAALVVDSVTPSSREVQQGQRGLVVQVALRNPGAPTSGATALGLLASLSFGAATAAYSVTTATANPTTLAAGATAVLTFTVDVGAAAPPGVTSFAAVLTALDANSGLAASLENPATAGWTVRTGASPHLSLAGPRRLSRGSSSVVTLTVSNTGQTTAEHLQAELLCDAPGARLSARQTGPTLLAGGASVTLVHDLSLDLTATVGVGTLTAAVRWTDPVAVAPQSTGVTWTFEAVNVPPTAAISSARAGTVTVPLELDGRGSFDGLAPAASEGDALLYRWSVLSRPEGSPLTATSFQPNGTAASGMTTALPGRKGAYVLGLVVNDSHDDSALATASVRVSNSRPAAVATVPVTATAGRAVALAGRASDADSEDRLEYTWGVESAPSGVVASAILFTPNGTAEAATSAFTPPAAGTYRLRLVAGDGTDESAPVVSELVAASGNLPPVARAVARAPGGVGTAVALDGRASYDPDGPSMLTYRWSFDSTPAGSAVTAGAIASNGTSAAAVASFVADRKGRYAVRLNVNDGQAESAPATAAVTVPNTPPSLSVAVSEVSTVLGSRVRLAATGTDADPGERLTYAWSFALVPAGSTVTTAAIQPNATTASASTSFLPDRTGTYALWATVSDGEASSRPALVNVGVRREPPPPNRPPLAAIRLQATGGGPRVVELDGRDSRDPEGGNLIYAWTLLEAPELAAPFSSATAVTTYPAFVPGTYRFVLAVFDESLGAGSATTTVFVEDVAPVADARGDRQLVLTRPDVAATVPTTLEALLDGTASHDPNGVPLTYLWRIVSAPDQSVGSTGATTLATLSGAAASRCRVSFAARRRTPQVGSPLLAAGSYLFALEVFDGTRRTTDTVRLDALDPRHLLPAADAGLDRTVRVVWTAGGGLEPTIPDPMEPRSPKDFVRLDGRESASGRGLPLTYTWSLVSQPRGSTLAGLNDDAGAFPWFRPRVEGPYVFELTVKDGLNASAPARVRLLVEGENRNRPPDAVGFVVDWQNVRSAGPLDPVLQFGVGERVVLDGALSSDADGDSLTYVWEQVAGSRVSLEPTRSAARVGFAPARPGRLTFRLTVADGQGASDSCELAVAVRREALPVLSIVASAPTVARTGQDLPESGVTLASVASLRVTTPVTVTLEGRLTPSSPPGQRCDFVWRQVAGPRVLLESPGEENTASLGSVTAFSPTTSRVHVFELTAFLLDGGGNRTGLFVRRHVRVLVDTGQSRVPVARATSSKATVSLTGTAPERTVVLDGSRSELLAAAGSAGQVLGCLWRQVAGPRGSIEDPLAPVTNFTAPVFSDGRPRQYVFELTVDARPPGDRSEPVYLAVAQQAVQPQEMAGWSRRGGGCVLGGPNASALVYLVLLVVPLGWMRARSPR